MATGPQFDPLALAETRHGNRGPHVFAMVIPPAFLASGAEPEWLSAQEKAARLAHSGERVLCAIAPAGLVGVDVERIRARKEWHALASFVLHPAERERLEALEGEPRWQGFYRVWTLKEAMAKALGVGLALPFNRISFSADNRIEAAPRGHALTAPAPRGARSGELIPRGARIRGESLGLFRVPGGRSASRPDSAAHG